MPIVAALLAVAVAIPQVAWADIPTTSSGPNQNYCFDLAVGQRASTMHDTGQHGSSFDEPRLGIGNLVFSVFGFESVGQTDAALAAINAIPATTCQ
jgi:hypothetical protein